MIDPLIQLGGATRRQVIRRLGERALAFNADRIEVPREVGTMLVWPDGRFISAEPLGIIEDS